MGLEVDTQKIIQHEQEEKKKKEIEEMKEVLKYYKSDERFKPVSHGRFQEKVGLQFYNLIYSHCWG